MEYLLPRSTTMQHILLTVYGNPWIYWRYGENNTIITGWYLKILTSAVQWLWLLVHHQLGKCLKADLHGTTLVPYNKLTTGLWPTQYNHVQLWVSERVSETIHVVACCKLVLCDKVVRTLYHVNRPLTIPYFKIWLFARNFYSMIGDEDATWVKYLA